jgi:uncharacterized protein (TIGR03437 family)
MVAAGLFLAFAGSAQAQHKAQVCDTDDLSDCYFIDTSMIGGLRFEDYKVTNPKAIQFDPALRLSELAAIGPSTAQTLCQAPPQFTTPAPSITFNNVQAQIRWQPAGNSFPDLQWLDVEFANFSASNGYTSPTFGFNMNRGVNLDGTLERQFSVYVHVGNSGLENVAGLTDHVGFVVDPVARTAAFSGTVPPSAMLRQAVFGLLANVQSILSAASFTTNPPPAGKPLWTASDIVALAAQAQPLIAAAPDAPAPIGAPFSCSVSVPGYTSCVGQSEMIDFEDTMLTWGGEYLGLRTSQSFNVLVRDLRSWAQANAPSLAPGASFHDSGAVTGSSYRYSMMEMSKPILTLWPTLRDDPALAVADRTLIDNWIANTLAPVAVFAAGFTNNQGYFGSSDQMADAIHRSDHNAFAASIEKFYVALNQMRSDGSFPLEAERSACSVTYSNVDIQHLVSIAEMAATQGYDLYHLSVNGKTLESAIEFLLNARENPTLLYQYSKLGGGVCFEGSPGNPPDFSLIFDTKNQSNLAWIEPYLARFPFSPTAARLRQIVGSNISAAPFPLWHAYSAVNTSCAFRKPYEFQPVNGVKIAAAGGDKQTVAPNQTVATPLSVHVTDSSGSVLAGVLVSFAVTQGSANLVAPAQALSNASGSASAGVIAGPINGPVTVTATTLGAAVSFTITTSGPAINAGGIVGIGASVPAVTAISPGALFSIYGQDFVRAGLAGSANSSNIVNGAFPTTLLGVCVTVGGLSAPLVGVTPGQINAIAPAVAPGSTVPIIVTMGCGTAGAISSSPQSVTVAAATPEFFYFAHNGNGQNPVAAVNSVSGAYIGPPSALGSAFSPAHPGDYVTIFAAGFGPTDPPQTPGKIDAGVARVTGSLTVTLGAVTLNPSDILYAGAAPGEVISQLNIRIPGGVTAGNQRLQITIGGIASPSGGYLAIATP